MTAKNVALEGDRARWRRRWAGTLAGLIVLYASAGCAQRRPAITEALPIASVATPWALEGALWTGDFDAARGALGDSADTWSLFQPQRVWLADYHHDTQRESRLTVRIFALASRSRAEEAYSLLSPFNRQELKAGDEACWLRDGVLIRWGKLVVEIFSADPQVQVAPEQAFYLWAIIEKRLTREMAESPLGP